MRTESGSSVSLQKNCDGYRLRTGGISHQDGEANKGKKKSTHINEMGADANHCLIILGLQYLLKFSLTDLCSIKFSYRISLLTEYLFLASSRKPCLCSLIFCGHLPKVICFLEVFLEYSLAPCPHIEKLRFPPTF